MTMSAAEKLEPSEEESAEKAKQLPEPRGYKILIAMPGSEEKTEGGIIKATVTRQLEEVGAMYGMVLKLGPDAYADKKRFPNGPYCKEGELILMRSYSGTRFKIHGKEFRLINDDSVEAVIDDPRGLEKI
jgi:co-chaperonin GroES (HSP10)|tara:strand:- start:452 stop:841 length:390 start_codon:yes stop_codon:yes gene_type:complete